MNNNELEKALKQNQKKLIIGIIFLFITALLIYLGYKETQKAKPDLVYLNELITSESKEVNVYSYLNVASVPYLFAVYENNGVEEDNKFYLVMDENDYLYILYMSDKNYARLNKDDIEENPIKVSGYTKIIASDIKNLAIDSYNELMKEEFLTNDNFSSYIGLIYLDMEEDNNASSVYYTISIFTFMFFVILVVLYFVTAYKSKRFLKKYSNEELNKINSEIYAMKNENNDTRGLYLIKDYLVDTNYGLTIIEYKDILWAYPFEQRQNGVVINKNIVVVTSDHKRYTIAPATRFVKDQDAYLSNILNKLQEKNKNILLGFTNENKKIMKDKKKKGL